MMQVTGSNITETIAKESILSIQLSLGGLSFCITTADHKPIEQAYYPLENNADLPTWQETVCTLLEREERLRLPYKQVAILWDTEKVCLVPTPLYIEGEGKAWLKTSGVQKTADDKCVASLPQGDVVAVMCFPKTLYKRLLEYYEPESICFVHPLLLNLARLLARPCVELRLSTGLVHLSVRKDQLLYAETLPYKTAADLLFALQEMDAAFGLKRFQILVSGVGAADQQKFLHPYYKKSTSTPNHPSP